MTQKNPRRGERRGPDRARGTCHMNRNSRTTTPAQRDTCRATRVRILLHLGQSFTRAQVADLMALAARWARESYEDEQNACYPPPPVAFAGRWIDQADERRKADAAGARRDDYRGGPVAGWDLGLEVAERAEQLCAELEQMERVDA